MTLDEIRDANISRPALRDRFDDIARPVFDCENLADKLVLQEQLALLLALLVEAGA